MIEQPPRDDAPTAYRSGAAHERGAGEQPGDLRFTPGQIVAERYRIVALIGRGGMGEVYRADDLKIGHPVALKFLARAQEAHRVYQEVRVGREISHPNVCRLYDAGDVGGRLFITMELIDGEDLASLLRRVGRLSVEKALSIARDIAAGLAAAHEKGILHRDLKPANVMIDGRGRARVTDFGLAVPRDAAGDRAGTPAYMAPEQLAGEPASVTSDLYALGLVVYEVFTGRRAFGGATVGELLAQERAAEFAPPSSVARDVPAAVERIIGRCLEAAPEHRPASAAEVLRELPGGDPLAVAIAAGETPTPGMVAAAAKTGALSPVAAWLLLAVALAGLVASATLSRRTVLSRAATMKAPDVLRERAREILARAGVTGRPADSDLFVHVESFTGQLTAVYRQSPRPMRARNPNGMILAFDPALDPGMANVHLDGEGRLRRFLVAPRVEEPAARGEISWAPFLAAAGFAPESVQRAIPEWPAAIIYPGRSAAAYVDTDRKDAWVARDGSRIEAGSFRGRPVFFSVITPEVVRVASVPSAAPDALPERLAFFMFAAFMIVLPVAALALARVNLRRGQGDRAGAFRTAMFFLVLAFIGFTFRAHHSGAFADEWTIITWQVVQSTFWALVTAIMYIATEPFVRKRWPQMLISWTRLLGGRLADPMVGRDVLLGAASAALAIVVWQATHLIVGQTAFFTSPSTLGPPRFVVYAVATTIAEALIRGVGLVILLVILRAVIPSDVAASVLTALLIATMALGDTYGPFWLRAVYALSASILGVMLARHFGVLAVMSYAFFVLVQQRLPFTLDGQLWFFGRSAVMLALLATLVALAFRASVGARRWLPRFELEPSS